MEDYADNAFTPVSASMDYILSLRTATSFRVYVIYIDIVSLIALVFSVIAIRQLASKQIFNRSITHLLIASLIYANAHNLSYTIIESWSLYRSFVYSKNPTSIMFTSEECFFQHVTNSSLRFLLIAIELALNLDRIIVILLGRFTHCYPNHRGQILNLISLISSFGAGWISHVSGPHPGVTTTSCFREVDITINLHSTNLNAYTILAACCAVLDFLMMWRTWKDQKQISYDLKSKYQKLELHYSLMAVSFNSLVQLFITLTYTILMYVMSKMSHQNPELGNANLLRWLYTTPYSTLLVPIQLYAFIIWIGRRRKQKINSVTRQSVSQDSHFFHLTTSWD